MCLIRDHMFYSRHKWANFQHDDLIGVNKNY